ncbi:hypothetical protein ACQ4LE_002875 [Meloidogyne hapla]
MHSKITFLLFTIYFLSVQIRAHSNPPSSTSKCEEAKTFAFFNPVKCSINQQKQLQDCCKNDVPDCTCIKNTFNRKDECAPKVKEILGCK